jgi:hypothetical protein
MTDRSRARFDDTIMLARDTVGKNPRQKKFKFVFREELALEMRVLACAHQHKNNFRVVDRKGYLFCSAPFSARLKFWRIVCTMRRAECLCFLFGET